MRFLVRSLLFWLLCALFFSCASYKQNIMFKLPDGFEPTKITEEALKVEQNYTIKPNDYLKLRVYSNKGEKLIDPNPELSNVTSTQQNREREEALFLVNLQGLAKFPMIGEVKIDGLTLRQAEELIQKEYQKYFKEPFTMLTYANKRVVVLGGIAGGQVVPLSNENMNLVEILGLAKGIDNLSKAHNIRVLRNDQVFLIDLSTIDGYKNGNLLMQSGDIIYVEPVRRPVSEAFRDYAGIISLAISVYVLIMVNNQ